MATLTKELSSQAGGVIIPDVPVPIEYSAQSNRLVSEIWFSAIQENMALAVMVLAKVLFGAALVSLVAISLPIVPTIGFYAAFSAGISILYFASLTDARGFRDAISLLVPAVFVLAVLLAAKGNPVLVGMTLFTHVVLAFSAGFSRSGGSLHRLGLWPVLFGVELVTLVLFMNQMAA